MSGGNANGRPFLFLIPSTISGHYWTEILGPQSHPFSQSRGTVDHWQRGLFVGSRVLRNLLPDPAFVVLLCLVSSAFMCLARLLRHSGGNCDALGRLDLVPGKHPYLDSGISELLDRFQHLVLELVFDAGTGQILHALFN